jgi:Bifunctional DNA primase/polymerase, N-terminal
MNALRDAALHYASCGAHVLPLHHIIFEPSGPRCSCGKPMCSSPGKHPRTRRGFKDASSDAAQIEAWWRQWPHANIGIATGPSGLVVLDVDGPEGQAELATLVAAHGFLPRTLVAKTGRPGGIHFYYKGAVPSGQDKRRHLDIRGTTGYVVAPPSNHASGQSYAWINAPQAIVAVPDWLDAWARGSGSNGAEQRPPGTDLPPWSPQEESRLRSALATIPADIDGRTWFSIGAALHDLHWRIHE